MTDPKRPSDIPDKAVLAQVWYVPGRGEQASTHDRVYDMRGILLAEYVRPEEYGVTLPEWHPAPGECDNCGRKLRVGANGRPIASHADDPYMRGHSLCTADPLGPIARVPEATS